MALYPKTSAGPAAHGLLAVFGEPVERLGSDVANSAALETVTAIHTTDRVADYQETGLRVWRYVDYLDVPTLAKKGLARGQYVRFPDDGAVKWFLADEIPNEDSWTRFPLQKYG